MKNKFIYALLGICFMSYAQEDLLPTKVEEAFQLKYPGISLDYWVKKNDLYFIEHDQRKSTFTAVFDRNGTWIETAEIISDFDIPQALSEFIEGQFPFGEVSYCEKVENTQTPEFYRVNLFDDGEYIIITADKEGKSAKITREEAE